MNLYFLTDRLAQIFHLITDSVKDIQEWEVDFQLFRNIFEFGQEHLVNLTVLVAQPLKSFFFFDEVLIRKLLTGMQNFVGLEPVGRDLHIE